MTVESGRGQEQQPARRSRIRSGDIFLVVLFAAIGVVLVNWRPSEIFGFLYHPVVGLVLLVMIVEFLWLKSGDRTRVYRLEIDKLRALRRKDQDLLGKARDVIRDGVQMPEAEENGRPGDWRQRALDTVKDIDERL